MKKPELLLPAGNIESFYAALEGGADAIYLGLKHFNARERAQNFSNQQVALLIDIAHKHNCKVYITLNTVVKNKEFSVLIDTLDFLQNAKPDALIIQDWGVYALIQRFFPTLTVHASTQMAVHNSIGAEFLNNKGFERVILARELTLREIESVNIKTEIETEVFIHGALCYSFSGMCNFSSYLGGHGANRGLCTQVCRRPFVSKKNQSYFFSLKDNEQIENIHQLIKAGVYSLKVEGRLKSDDYVYTVARAYKMLIENKQNLPLAKKLLLMETGRAKTGYFIANDLSDAITYKSPNTGLYVGKINEIYPDGFDFISKFKIDHAFRIRIKHPNKETQQNLKIKTYTLLENNRIRVFHAGDFVKGSKLFLSGINEKKFPSKLNETPKKNQFGIQANNKQKMLNSFRCKSLAAKEQLFVRIDSLEWMKKIHFDEVDHIIFSFVKKDLDHLNAASNFIQKFKKKILIELPHFIPEQSIDYYKNICKRMSSVGLNRFFLSHISQKIILPKNSKFACNENVYVYNDAAAHFFKLESAEYITYPFENDSENYTQYMHTEGIVPVYFRPKLFISRMPVKINSHEAFKDDIGNSYFIAVKDGIRITIPQIPVSFLQYVNTFRKQSFKNYLIDFSFEKASSNRFKTILKRFKQSQQIQPSTNYNYKRVLK